MTRTYYQLTYHLVWSTKDRKPMITKDIQPRLYEYIGGIFCAHKCHPILFGGMSDHIHLCVEIPPTSCISDVIRSVKIGSSKWCHSTFPQQMFEWQEGYGAFSVSPSSRAAVIAYIKEQEEHHKKKDFREEFLWFLENYGIHYDEKYLWK